MIDGIGELGNSGTEELRNWGTEELRNWELGIGNWCLVSCPDIGCHLNTGKTYERSNQI